MKKEKDRVFEGGVGLVARGGVDVDPEPPAPPLHHTDLMWGKVQLKPCFLYLSTLGLRVIKRKRGRRRRSGTARTPVSSLKSANKCLGNLFSENPVFGYLKGGICYLGLDIALTRNRPHPRFITEI